MKETQLLFTAPMVRAVLVGVDVPDGLRRCGHNGCRVWMVDDDRPWCEVCKMKREPYVVVRDGRWVWVEGESNG